jgi:hypothetical protein
MDTFQRARLYIPIFVPLFWEQEFGAGFLLLLGFLWNPEGICLIFLFFTGRNPSSS